MSLPGSNPSASARVRGLPRPILAMVTDRRLYLGASAADDANEGACAMLVSGVAASARAGVTLVQVRERGLDDRSLLALAVSVREAIAGTAARMLVNDRIDVALAARADGVHLPGRAVSSAVVRGIVPDGFLVGRSVHSAGEAIDAERDGGCDYLVFGSVFESPSKPAGYSVAGLDALARVCGSVRLPVLAIGGVTAARVPDVVRAGAAGVAAIGLFATGGDVQLRDTVRQIRLAFGVS
jgi:thiamine-phosphate pyrophosphorylase